VIRPRSSRARRRPWPAALALLVPSAVHAAAYLPGADDADPPTGESTPAPTAAAEPLRDGEGIRWTVAPWRSAGSIALDTRWLRFEDRRQATQAALFGDIDFASYVYQPWFIQLRAGVGLLAVRDAARGGDAEATGGGSGAVTGRIGLAVFPASRFPFELRADVGDSRTSGDTLGTDYRSLRVSASQSWRPEAGNDSVNLTIDHSRLLIDGSGSDTLNVVNANAMRQLAEHTFELVGSLSDNERSDSGEHNRLGLLSARHGFHPNNDLRVETLATWNDARLRSGDLESSSDVRQLSTFATWRPQEGEPLYVASSPVTLAASARWVESGSSFGDTTNTVRGFNATLGLSQELTREWRLAASVAAGRVDGASQSASTGNGNASVTWTSLPLTAGDWRWTPGVSASVGMAHTSEGEDRRIVGAQGTHSLTRDITLGPAEALSVSLSQTAAVLYESMAGADSRAFVHSASVYWQDSGDSRRQSFAGVSFSDSRTWSQGRGSFQLANLQWSQRLQFSRYSSGSANITLQATRNASTQIDAFTGERREQSGGWQHFYNGSLNLEQQKLFDVPRLRYTLLVGANSQQLDRRAAGDIDAPRERITASVENRLDYQVGRLESRLSVRGARVDGRTVAAIVARVQRRF